MATNAEKEFMQAALKLGKEGAKRTSYSYEEDSVGYCSCCGEVFDCKDTCEADNFDKAYKKLREESIKGT